MSELSPISSAHLEVELEIPSAGLDVVEKTLAAAGALTISLTDPGGEPVLEPAPGEMPLWSSVRVSALFDAAVDAAALRDRIAAATGIAVNGITTSILPPKDWVREFRENLRPLCFGGRLWLCPGEQPCPDPGAIALRLEPGLAFGSGSHATTAMCLDWLTTLDLGGRRLLDWGCGSGVLAIAGVALGAAHATALDIDPQALTATADNARRNDVGAALTIGHPDGLAAGDRYDVLVANILANSLIALAPRFRDHCVAGAPVAMSGILAAQAAQVRAACAPQFALEVMAERDGWALLAGTAI
jgi:ribosomal protein L11 methyltransferase